MVSQRQENELCFSVYTFINLKTQGVKILCSMFYDNVKELFFKLNQKKILPQHL